MTVYRRSMAGHSKWANIKFKKMHRDIARAKILGRLHKEIVAAVRGIWHKADGSEVSVYRHIDFNKLMRIFFIIHYSLFFAKLKMSRNLGVVTKDLRSYPSLQVRKVVSNINNRRNQFLYVY